MKSITLYALLSTKALGMTLGPNFSYEKQIDGKVSSKDEAIDNALIKESTITNINVMTPGPSILNGDIIILLSYQQDKFILNSKSSIKKNYESLPTGFVWLGKNTENQWLTLYRRWQHPTFKFDPMHDFVIGKSIALPKVSYLGFKNTSNYLILRYMRFPNYEDYNLILRTRFQNSKGGDFNFHLTAKGPSKITLGIWKDDSLYEAGLKVDDLIGITKEEKTSWRKGYQASLFAGFSTRVWRPIFVNISGGAKMIERSSVESKTGKVYQKFSQMTPFIKASIETWI